MEHSFEGLNNLIPAYAVLNRIRVSSTTEVLASAERVIEYIMAAYSGPNLTLEEIQSRAAKREDPLRDFSDICRSEIESLWKGL
jgi:hypothetical protein